MNSLLLRLKSVPFSSKRYVLPLIALPFLLFMGFQFSRFSAQSPQPELPPELSLSLGESSDSILTKNQAYDHFFALGETPSSLMGLEEEPATQLALGESPNPYNDNTSGALRPMENKGYPGMEGSRDLIRRINEASSQRPAPSFSSLPHTSAPLYGASEYSSAPPTAPKEKELSPAEMMREQMLLLDSLEKARDPDQKKKSQEDKEKKQQLERKQKELLSVKKISSRPEGSRFNGSTSVKDSPFLSAVLDQGQSGYLGSRISIRLLQDIYVGDRKIPSQSLLYAQVTGFTQERIKLSVISLLLEGEILPVRLSIYDLDGLEGLYVPGSAFREMLLEMGESSVQGTTLDAPGQAFYTSLLSSALRSASQSASRMLRKNKAHLKLSTQIYLKDVSGS